jgi:hypothetical protein
MNLTEFELANVEAAARAVFPKNAHPELTTGAEDLDVRGYFKDVIGRSNLRIAAALRLTILFCAFGPLIAQRRFTTLASQDDEEREETMKLVISSPIYAVRQLVLLLKVHLAMIVGADPIARRVMLPERVPYARAKTLGENRERDLAISGEQPLVTNLLKGARRDVA